MTGLADRFDFRVNLAGWDRAARQSDIAPSRSEIVIAVLQEQLGLKLEARKAPVEVLVIDRVEQPAPD